MESFKGEKLYNALYGRHKKIYGETLESCVETVMKHVITKYPPQDARVKGFTSKNPKVQGEAFNFLMEAMGSFTAECNYIYEYPNIEDILKLMKLYGFESNEKDIMTIIDIFSSGRRNLDNPDPYVGYHFIHVLLSDYCIFPIHTFQRLVDEYQFREQENSKVAPVMAIAASNPEKLSSDQVGNPVIALPDSNSKDLSSNQVKTAVTTLTESNLEDSSPNQKRVSSLPSTSIPQVNPESIKKNVEKEKVGNFTNTPPSSKNEQPEPLPQKGSNKIESNKDCTSSAKSPDLPVEVTLIEETKEAYINKNRIKGNKLKIVGTVVTIILWYGMEKLIQDSPLSVKWPARGGGAFLCTIYFYKALKEWQSNKPTDIKIFSGTTPLPFGGELDLDSTTSPSDLTINTKVENSEIQVEKTYNQLAPFRKIAPLPSENIIKLDQYCLRIPKAKHTKLGDILTEDRVYYSNIKSFKTLLAILNDTHPSLHTTFPDEFIRAAYRRMAFSHIKTYCELMQTFPEILVKSDLESYKETPQGHWVKGEYKKGKYTGTKYVLMPFEIRPGLLAQMELISKEMPVQKEAPSNSVSLNQAKESKNWMDYIPFISK